MHNRDNQQLALLRRFSRKCAGRIIVLVLLVKVGSQLSIYSSLSLQKQRHVYHIMFELNIKLRNAYINLEHTLNTAFLLLLPGIRTLLRWHSDLK